MTTAPAASPPIVHALDHVVVAVRDLDAAVAAYRALLAPEPAAVSGLDHVVIRTPDPERATALYGARLDLDMRLDRANPAWGALLLFFRCGDLIVEVAHDLKAGVGDGPDRLWGLSWRGAAAEEPAARAPAAQAR